MQQSPSTKKNKLPLSEVSQQLDLPLSAIYGALVFIVLVAGVIATSQALSQSQNLVGQADTFQTVDCNQPCANNRYCKPNHFCYQGKCRLASNPENPNCLPTSVTQEIEESKGADVSTDTIDKPASDQDDTATTPATIQQPDNETDLSEIEESSTEDQARDQGITDSSQNLGILDQLMGEDNSQLFVVLGVGAIGLLVVVAVITILSSSSKKPSTLKPVETPDFSDLEKK